MVVISLLNLAPFVTHLFTTVVLVLFPHSRAGYLRPEEDWWLEYKLSPKAQIFGCLVARD